jgi:CubicO group peptidase (beta-lactamase class C family)
MPMCSLVVLWSAMVWASAPMDDGPDAAPSDASAVIEPIRAAHKVPGMVGAVLIDDRIVAIGASGVRKMGSPEPITSADILHLGSNTKSMTSTMIARLVERGKLRWDMTPADVFTDFADAIHPDCRSITLRQMLTHRSGLPANGRYVMLGGKDESERRLKLARATLTAAPEAKPGTRFEYSNLGYIIAGAMAERVTGKSWEDLMRDEVFIPLGMTGTAGFGPPGSRDTVEQPWGHMRLLGAELPVFNDNPPVLGPAGTVHASVADWMKYARVHMKNAGPDAAYLKPESFAALHTPEPGIGGSGADYACGWVVRRPPWGKDGERVIWHNGSNTHWYAEMWIDQARGLVVLVGSNGSLEGGAAQAVPEAAAALAKAYGPPSAR